MNAMPPSVPRQGDRHPFSLIELLFVFTIIAILVAIGIGVFGVAQNQLGRARTRHLCKIVDVALGTYKDRFGYLVGNIPLNKTFRIHRRHTDHSGCFDGPDRIAWCCTCRGCTMDDDPMMTILDSEDLINRRLMKVFGRGSGIRNDKDFMLLVDGFNSSMHNANTGPLYYRYPGWRNKSGYDLASFGPNRATGGARADGSTNNWGWYEISHHYACNPPIFRIGAGDDITNFTPE